MSTAVGILAAISDSVGANSQPESPSSGRPASFFLARPCVLCEVQGNPICHRSASGRSSGRTREMSDRISSAPVCRLHQMSAKDGSCSTPPTIDTPSTDEAANDNDPAPANRSRTRTSPLNSWALRMWVARTLGLTINCRCEPRRVASSKPTNGRNESSELMSSTGRWMPLARLYDTV